MTSLYWDILLPEYSANALTNHVSRSTSPNTPVTRYIEPATCVVYEKYTVTSVINAK